jgi:endonuclease/exonuclease/phosphatase (EEP) superfamily protein YafD
LVLALAGTLGVVPVVAARVLGGVPPQPGPQLAALAPVAAGVAVVAFLAAVLGRARWAAVVPGVLLAALLWWQVGPALTGWWQGGSRAPSRATTGAASPGGGHVRVMTVNAEFGRVDAAELVTQVRNRRVDVLTVQELTPDLVTRLDAAGLDQELPSPVLRAQPGYQGTGIWSRWPVTPLGDVPGTNSATPRALVHPPTGEPFTVIAVHPMAPAGPGADRLWRADLHRLRTATQEALTGPVVVAGDFNATRDHALFRDLLATGLGDALDDAPNAPWLGFTFPVGRRFPPIMRLDHVLYSERDLECASATTLTLPGTDHRTVLATLHSP